jgi:lipopolysaccharide biosynthesis glycosyltransferase
MSGEQVPTQPLRVMCAADAGYAAPLCVMLVSLVVNHTSHRKLEIYVVGSDMPEKERRKIEGSISANRPDFDLSGLHWLSPNKEMLAGLESGMHITVETYSRFLAPYVLPQDWDRVLYLDCDLVVLSDLSALYDYPCDGKAILAIRDMEIGQVSAPAGVYNYAEMGISPDAHYFNAGVILMNLDLWRRDNLTPRIIDYLKTHKESMHYWDQGAMNAVLHDSWTEVDPGWNQHRGILFPHLRKGLGYSRAAWKEILYQPKIVHYTGPEKPWQLARKYLRLPRYSSFFTYLAKTEYRDVYPIPWVERTVGLRIYFHLWRTIRNSYLLLSGKSRRLARQEAEQKEVAKKSAVLTAR